MVGHVEGVETGRGIGVQRIGRSIGIEPRAVLLQIGDLPQSADQAADVQPAGKVDAMKDVLDPRTP